MFTLRATDFRQRDSCQRVFADMRFGPTKTRTDKLHTSKNGTRHPSTQGRSALHREDLRGVAYTHARAYALLLHTRGRDGLYRHSAIGRGSWGRYGRSTSSVVVTASENRTAPSIRKLLVDGTVDRWCTPLTRNPGYYYCW